MFHAAWCSAGASDYIAKVSGDQVGFMKNEVATAPNYTAPHHGKPEVATAPNYTAQKALCNAKLHNPGY